MWRRGQVFVFDVTLAAVVFVTLILVVFAMSTRYESDNPDVLSMCSFGLWALAGNGTLEGVASGAISETYLNTSLSLLPDRLGYELNLTTYYANGTMAASHLAWTGNASEAESMRYVAAAGSSLVTANASPLFGEARMRCWVKR